VHWGCCSANRQLVAPVQADSGGKAMHAAAGMQPQSPSVPTMRSPTGKLLPMASPPASAGKRQGPRAREAGRQRAARLRVALYTCAALFAGVRILSGAPQTPDVLFLDPVCPHVSLIELRECSSALHGGRMPSWQAACLPSLVCWSRRLGPPHTSSGARLVAAAHAAGAAGARAGRAGPDVPRAAAAAAARGRGGRAGGADALAPAPV